MLPHGEWSRLSLDHLDHSEVEMYNTGSIKQYMEDLAAKKPAPGGGSAAALVGAAGAALLEMVCNFTLGKKKYAAFEPDIKKILARSEAVRKRLTELIDEDVRAYNEFTSSAKDDKALQAVQSVPLEICRLTKEALKLCPELARKGNRMLISDVGCAREMLKAAFLSAQKTIK